MEEIISLDTILNMRYKAYKFYGRVTHRSLYLGLFLVNYRLKLKVGRGLKKELGRSILRGSGVRETRPSQKTGGLRGVSTPEAIAI